MRRWKYPAQELSKPKKSCIVIVKSNQKGGKGDRERDMGEQGGGGGGRALSPLLKVPFSSSPFQRVLQRYDYLIHAVFLRTS